MTLQRDELIKDIAQGLTPVQRPGSTSGLFLLWLTASSLFVVSIMWMIAPFRPGWVIQLLNTPQFFIESLLGLIAIAALTNVTFKWGIPGYPRLISLTVLASLLMLTWISFYIFGLHEPALEISMLGKRAHCYLEVLIYSIPPIIFAALLLRKLAVTQQAWVGVLVAVCASAIPALLMQIACMYAPKHILAYHIAPMLVTLPLGALLAWLILRREKN